MITVYPVLWRYMRDQGVTIGDLATVANTSKIAVHLKLAGIKRWKLTEVLRICCFFRSHDSELMFEKSRVRIVR